MASISLPPDYFRLAEEKYNENPTNRKEWLRDQISRTNTSLLQYQSEVIDLYSEAEKLGAVFKSGVITGVQSVKGESGIITGAGAVLASIPAGYTQVIGGILILAGSFFSKAENKANVKQIGVILSIAQTRIKEANEIGAYQKKYKTELMWLSLLPFLLMAALIFLMLRN